MNDRPELRNGVESAVFRSFYWLKEELTDFCRQEGLQSTGGKIELTDRIATYLASGEKTTRISRKVQKLANIGIITEETLIEPSFVCSELHRTFFTHAIGKTFSFNVAFQKWLKANTGKTYKEAIVAYYQILVEKKKGSTIIDSQFEYNTYIRAFFAANEGRTLKEAILCWKYKKSLQGNNCYEQSDLRALAEEGYQSMVSGSNGTMQVTAAILKNEQGEILLCQRGAGGSCAFLWEFPGGKIEEGETAENCIVRECHEELGITICVDGIFAKTVYEYDEAKIDFTFFTGTIIEGSPKISVHVAINWVKPSALSPYNFCPADREIATRIKDENPKNDD